MPTYNFKGPMKVSVDLTFDAEDEADAWAKIDEQIAASVKLLDHPHEVDDESISELDLAISRVD